MTKELEGFAAVIEEKRSEMPGTRALEGFNELMGEGITHYAMRHFDELDKTEEQKTKEISEIIDISDELGISIPEAIENYRFLSGKGGRFRGKGVTGEWQPEGWRGWDREFKEAKEKILNINALDLISHLPGAAFVGLNNLRKKIYETAKAKLERKDYSPARQWAMTPMGGYMTVNYPTTRDELVETINAYEEREALGEGVIAAVMAGIADLPAYMAEMAAMGIGNINSVPRAFAFAGKALTVQFGRIEDAMADQLERGEKGYMALAKSIGDVYIENLSETAGAGVAGAINRLPFGSKLIEGMRKYFASTGMAPNEFWARMGTRLGYNGLLGEWGEERLATYLRGLVNTNDFGTGDDATADQRIMAGLAQDLQIWNQIKEIGVIAAPGAARFVAGKVVPKEKPAEVPSPPEVTVEKPEAPAEAVLPVAPAAPEAKRKITPTEAISLRPELATSAVQDTRGKPLLVYHGTGVDFASFQESESGLYYFAENKAYAEWYTQKRPLTKEEIAEREKKPFEGLVSDTEVKYAKGRIIEAYLNIQNPVELEDIDLHKTYTLPQFRDILSANVNSKFANDIYNEYIEQHGPMHGYEEEGFPEVMGWEIVQDKRFKDVMIKNGYDGLVTYEGPSLIWAATSPEQIISTTLTKAPAEAKQPWEMTQEEYTRYRQETERYSVVAEKEKIRAKIAERWGKTPEIQEFMKKFDEFWQKSILLSDKGATEKAWRKRVAAFAMERNLNINDTIAEAESRAYKRALQLLSYPGALTNIEQSAQIAADIGEDLVAVFIYRGQGAGFQALQDMKNEAVRGTIHIPRQPHGLSEESLRQWKETRIASISESLETGKAVEVGRLPRYYERPDIPRTQYVGRDIRQPITGTQPRDLMMPVLEEKTLLALTDETTSPLKEEVRQKVDNAIIQANQEGRDPFAFVLSQIPEYDSIVWNVWQQSRQWAHKKAGKKSILKSWPSSSMAKARMKGRSIEPHMRITGHIPSGHENYVKDLKKNPIFKNHVDLTYDISEVIANESQTNRSIGQNATRLAKEQKQSLFIAGRTSIDPLTRRIQITIHRQGFGETRILAEEIYHVGYNIVTIGMPDINRSIQDWYANRIRIGLDPTIDVEEAFATAMSIEETIGGTDLPENIVNTFKSFKDGSLKINDAALNKGISRMLEKPRLAMEYEPQYIKAQHTQIIKKALQEGKSVPRNVLEEYQSEPWAQEALAKMPVAPEKPVVAEGVEKPIEAKAKTVKLPEIASGMMPQKAPGLTKAEVEHLGKAEQRALRAAQKLGYPVGYKRGYEMAALTGRRKLDALRTDVLIGQKSREDAKDVIKEFVPKEDQGRYLTALARTKTPKDVEKITNRIERFINKYEHRHAVTDFKSFVRKALKNYRRGEIKLGKLTGPVKARLEQVLNEYDLAKLSEEKEEELVKHKEHIQKIAGSIAQAFREWDALEGKEAEDIFKLPNRRIQDLERLEKQHIGTLTTEEIKTIQDELQSLLTSEERKKTIRDAIRSKYAHTYITESVSELHDRGETKAGEKAEVGIIKRGLVTEQANLRTLIRELGIKDVKAMEEFLVDRVWGYNRDGPVPTGLRRKAELIVKWRQSAQKGLQDLGLDETFLKDYYSDVTVTLGGQKKTVPKWLVFNCYMDAEADGNLKRLLTAREHRFFSAKRKPVLIENRITLDELNEAMKLLDDRYKKLATFMFRHKRENNAKALNATSLWERGYPIAIFEKYHSFRRYMSRLPAGQRTEVALAGEKRGRYQQRTGGTLPHQINDPLVSFFQEMEEDADYAAMQLIREDAKALLGNPKWRERARRTGNERIVESIIRMYQRAEGMVTDQDIADYLAGKYLSKMGKGTLSARPSGMFVQMASIPAAYPIVEQRYFDPLYVPKLKDYDFLAEKYPTLWLRWHARHFNFVLGIASARDRLHEIITGKPSVSNALIRHYTLGDQWAIAKIYKACERKINQTTTFKQGSSEYEEALEQLFFRAMESQPQWDTWMRTLTTSQTGMVGRSFSLFMSARIQQWNVSLQAIDDWQKGRITKVEAFRRIGDVAEANLRVGLYRELFRKLVKYMALGVLLGVGKRDEEDLKEQFEKDFDYSTNKLMRDWTYNIIGLPVYGGIVATAIDEGMRGLTGRPSKVEYKDVRTGSVLTDFIVDSGLAFLSAGRFGRDLWLAALDDEDGFYKSGPRKGEPRWKYSGLELVNDIGEIVSQLTGYGYGGPRSDIAWPVEQALKEEPEPKRRPRRSLRLKTTRRR